MNEIGGYNLFINYSDNIVNSVLFNSKHYKFALARHSLVFIINNFKFKRIILPSYTCNSIYEIIKDLDITILKYNLSEHFLPSNININDSDLLVVNNYFGLFDNYSKLHKFISQFTYNQILIDNSHSISKRKSFKNNLSMISPRKFLALTDGGILYDPKALLNDEYLPKEVDLSWERSKWLFRGYDEGGRYKSYYEYLKFRESIQSIPYKEMSLMTIKLISQYNLDKIISERRKVFFNLKRNLGLPKVFKQIKFSTSSLPIGFPLEVSDNIIAQKYFSEKKIYTVCYWNNQSNISLNEFEKFIASKILFLPLDINIKIDQIIKGISFL